MKKIYIGVFLFGSYLLPTLVKAQTSTFNDVAAIFYAKCASCHNPNGIGPFSLTKYSEVQPYAQSIKTDVTKGVMPPWAPDSTYTHNNAKFLHSRALTAAQKTAIIKWVNDGALQGNTNQAPVCPPFNEHHVLAGKADLVVGLGVVKSNAGVNGTTSDPYNCFVVPAGLTEDKWLRAVEIVPGNKKAVHHIVVTVDTSGATSDLSGSCNSQPGFGIGGWSSGAAPVVYPNKAPFKAGQRIPKGASIVIQVHFAPGSGGMLDSSKVRLYFYHKDSTAGIRPVVDQVTLQNWGISFGGAGGITQTNIPAKTALWITADTAGLAPGGKIASPKTDITIIASNPHSHFVCTKIVNYAFNGTDTIPLIRINNWDYRWQGYYYYDKPVKVPSTHKLQSKHFYDNTGRNKALITDSTKAVTFGTKTTNEMLFDDFVYTTYRTGDENIDMAAILQGDTIYATSTSVTPYERAITVTNALTLTDVKTLSADNRVIVSPNPANNVLNISVNEKSEYAARLYSLTGQVVLQTEFSDNTTVDVSNVSRGLFILEITNVKTGERTTKKIVLTP